MPTSASPLPIWRPEACIPRKEILEGKLTDAELALRLSTVISGQAKPPYNDPETFYEATHLTRNMKTIINDVLARLARKGREINPIIVLDVGFGGGKTHTLVALYYAAKYGNNPKIKERLGNPPIPENVRIVAISGEDYGDKGVNRNGTLIKTIWGDFFYQLGKYEKYKELDTKMQVPSPTDLKEALEGGPVLILLDELPTYLNLVASKRNMLDKTIQWIQRLVIAVSEKEDAALVVAIAEDVYRDEAEKARRIIKEKAKEALEEARAHIRRKELVLVPVEEEDAVHILKRRLFKYINPEAAKRTAEAYHELYNSLPVPDELKSSAFKDEIEEYYPFHPMLIKVLYERVATIDKFQRTRGALRLMARVVRKIWEEKSEDASLIMPYHVDLADDEIRDELTTHIGESKLRNAIEADVWNDAGTATAQKFDKQAISHWEAPLVRRACNIVYLYSLATGRLGDRGIRSDLLVSLSVTPVRREDFMKVRDIVLKILSDEFHYIDKQGERFVFVREPTPVRVIDLQARDVTEEEVIELVKEKLIEIFQKESKEPSWIYLELFPPSPGRLPDEAKIQVAILNPVLHTLEGTTIPETIQRFMKYRDDQGNRPRRFINSTFLLVASEENMSQMKKEARKVFAARMVRDDPQRYGIPKDRKQDVEEYLSRHEKLLTDNVRACFSKLVYQDKDGIKVITLSSAAYGNGKGGKEVLRHILSNVLTRVYEEPLDPEYVLMRIWPRDAKYVGLRTLFEAFHRIPGVIIPATKEVFIRTIEKGIRDNLWYLWQDNKLYEKELPKSILITNETELLLPEEVERRRIEKMETVQRTEVSEAVRSKEAQYVLPRVYTISISETPIKILAGDFDKRIRREKVIRINTIRLKASSATPSHILYFKNIMIRLEPVKDCETRLIVNMQRYSNPVLSLSLDVDKEGFSKSEGKEILDIIWRLKNVDRCDIDFVIEWKNGSKPEDAINILQSLGSEVEELMVRLEAEVER